MFNYLVVSDDDEIVDSFMSLELAQHSAEDIAKEENQEYSVYRLIGTAVPVQITSVEFQRTN